MLYLYVILAPVGSFLGYTQFGEKPLDLQGILLILGSTLFFGGFVYVMRLLAKLEQGKIVEIDYQNGLVNFHGYKFVTKFTGDKKQALVQVPFAGIYKTMTTYSKGNAFLNVSTEKGAVTLVGLKDMENLIQDFEEIFGINKKHNPNFQAEAEAAPRAKTAWYGWVILGSAVLGIIYVGWLTLYKS